jgi:uncharacterized protein YpiB (UPF0302 family)
VSGVTVEQKKEFLRWFLSNYQLRKREGVWILNYLISSDQLMHKVHFVEKVEVTPRGIIMSTRCAEVDVPFRYYKDNLMNTDAEKCFHDIRLNREKELYIELIFKDKYKYPEYFGILEANPFDDGDTSEFSDQAAEFLDYCLYQFKVSQLKRQIDEAIEKGDRCLFFKLTDELNNMKKIDRESNAFNWNRVKNVIFMRNENNVQ